jgi:ABC-type glutathione transport system ATPase component
MRGDHVKPVVANDRNGWWLFCPSPLAPVLPASQGPGTALLKPMGTGMMSAVASTTLLAVRDIGVRFGGIVALDGVSFDLAPRQLLGLIGPNGAGKTTLFNCLSRLYTPVRGDILFDGGSILKTPPHGIVKIGITRTFQKLVDYLDLRDVAAQAARMPAPMGWALGIVAIAARSTYPAPYNA